MRTTVTYLFDPLCGWCYGASSVIERLSQQSDLKLELAPTGLFAGGGRTMDAAFADYAWSNDLRIAKMSGQRFTEPYRTQVLGKLGSPFDSATATLALTAVSLTEPARELDALMVLQEARYVHGLDTTDVLVVEKLLLEIDLADAAHSLVAEAAELHFANDARLQHAQLMMQALGASGVPAIVVTADGGGVRQVPSNALYGGFDELLNLLNE